MIDSIDALRPNIDSTVNLMAERQNQDHHDDENNYQMFPGRQTATAKSNRNHRFQIQSMKRPTSQIKQQRFEQLTPRQRQRRRQELIDRFKSNVTIFQSRAFYRSYFYTLLCSRTRAPSGRPRNRLSTRELGSPGKFSSDKISSGKASNQTVFV